MSVFNRARSSFLVILSFVLLLCCGLAATWLLWQQEQSDQWVRHTVQVQSNLAQGRVLRLRAEVARRGFALSGDPRDAAVVRDVRRDVGVRLSARRQGPLGGVEDVGDGHRTQAFLASRQASQRSMSE